jgi:biopolymer transport protein ExbB
MSTKETKGNSLRDALASIFATSVILIAIALGFALYYLVMGDKANFEGFNVEKGHPINYLGIIYRGGMIVPLLMAVIIILFTFTIERLISISRAKGKGRLNVFVNNIRTLLNEDRIEDAAAACDKQRGSIANVIKSGLHRYRELQAEKTLPNDQKVLALQKDLEEATALELPILSKNLVVLSTIASISVLIGLIGTVLGMIRAFKALASSGSPDALALSTGISEALINTAFGIAGSTIALIAYNYFSSSIDALTFKIDEANFSVTQTFASNLKK